MKCLASEVVKPLNYCRNCGKEMEFVGLGRHSCGMFPLYECKNPKCASDKYGSTRN